jgi:hypothetical protein
LAIGGGRGRVGHGIGDLAVDCGGFGHVVGFNV